MLLGIDVGTTATKAVLVDERGCLIAEGSAEYGLSQPRPGWCEQDAEDWWFSLVSAVSQALQGTDRAAVRALGLSTQGDTLVPVNAAGRPLTPARTWMDTRTSGLVAGFEGSIGAERLYRVTGSPCGAFAAALTILWLREEAPEVFSGAARFSLVADFLTQRLSGQPALDHPNASRTLLFDIHRRDWDADLMAAVGIGPERLAPTLPSGTVVGPLAREAAQELGLSTETLVCVGGHDQTCAAVGAGVVRPGSMLLSCGTAWVLLSAAGEPLLDPQLRRVQTYCHAAPDRWALLTAQAGGNVLAWLRDTLYPPGTSFEEIMAEVAQVEEAHPDHQLLVLPHFYGALQPSWMKQAKGVVLGLTLSHGRKELAHGVVRGIALEVLRNVSTFRDMGAQGAEVRMIGGGARSVVWAQMIADAVNLPVTLPAVREAAAYGAALLAGVGCGMFRSVEEVVGGLPIRQQVEPRPDRTEHFAQLFARFEQACLGLRPFWESSATEAGGVGGEK